MLNDQNNPTDENPYKRVCFTLFGRKPVDWISAAGGAAWGGYLGFQSSNLFSFNDNSTEATLIWVLAASGLGLCGACAGAINCNLAVRGIREIFKCLTRCGYQEIRDIEEGTHPAPQIQ